MKRIIIATILAGCMMTAHVSAGEMLAGGWQATKDTAIDDKAQAAFDAALDGYTGMDLEPIDLLATQVVAGTNYCFLCRSAVVVPDAVPGYSLVYVYEDLQGDAEITSVQEITFGEGNLDAAEGSTVEQKD